MPDELGIERGAKVTLAAAGHEEACALERDAQALQVVNAEPSRTPGCEDSPCPNRPYSRDPKELLERGVHHLDGECVHVGERPGELWIDVEVEPGTTWRCQLVRREGVVAHEPIRLVETVLAAQGHRSLSPGKTVVLHHGHVGRKEDSLEAVVVVQGLRELQDVVVILGGCPNDYLRGLAGWCERPEDRLPLFASAFLPAGESSS